MELIGCGSDWITLSNSVPDGYQGETLHDVYLGLYALDKRWAGGGYQGSECEETGLKYGQRTNGDGLLEELLIGSGKQSETVLIAASNIDRYTATRFDLQVTVKLDTADVKLAERLYDKWECSRQFGTSDIGRRKPGLIKSRTGTTVYLGSRKSGRKFFRLYDKSYDYEEEIGTIWRQEIQYGRDLANKAVGWYTELGFNDRAVIDVVCSEFSEAMAFSLYPGVYAAPEDFREEKQEPTTAQKKLLWLTRCVRPTITFLIAAGFLEEAKAALGIPEKWS